MPQEIVTHDQANVEFSEKIQILKKIFNEKFPVLPNSIDDNGKVKEANKKMLAQLLFNNNQTSKTVIDETLSKFLSKINPKNKKTFDEIAEEIISEQDETKGNLSGYFLPKSQKGYCMHLGPINPSTEDHFGVPPIPENEDWEMVIPSPTTSPKAANKHFGKNVLENSRS